MKVDILGSVYEKGVLEFLEFSEKMFPTIMVYFIVPVVFVGMSRNCRRKKYSITYVVMEYVKIIQHGRGIEKWIKMKCYVKNG